MSETNVQQPSQNESQTVFTWLRRNVPFLIAVVVLLAAVLGWNATVEAFKFVTSKEPVPWPEGVEVDHQEFRVTSFPDRMGPYRLAKDGELFGKKDGTLDGEHYYEEDIKESLKIGTTRDAERVGERQSNWYISRRYIDTSKSANHPYRAWTLDITYYTGGLDKVPHIPDRCLVAGGSDVQGRNMVEFDVPVLDKRFDAWKGKLACSETRYTRKSSRFLGEYEGAQYYFFAINGKSEHDWMKVRLQVASPFVRHVYFAKVQFAPLAMNIDDFDVARKETQKFVKHFLPHVLKTLPMPQDVESLKAQEKSADNSKTSK